MGSRNILILAGISGALAVGLGAFGAHGLEPMLEAAGRVDTFETAVSYHFYHTLLLVGLGILNDKLDDRFSGLAVIFVTAGIIIFSGSLYILCLTGVTWLGAVTPIGGICLIVGWLLLARSALSSFKKT